MAEVVPTLNDGTAHYQQLTQLDGSLYKLVFDWNPVSEHWYLSVYTSSDEPLKGCMNMKLVQNWLPMRLARDLRRPPGQFFVGSEGHEEPGIFDLGGNTYLYYLSEGEL